MGGWMDGWLENEFLKKTPSPKFGLESQLGTSDFGVCQFQSWHVLNVFKKKMQGPTNTLFHSYNFIFNLIVSS